MILNAIRIATLGAVCAFALAAHAQDGAQELTVEQVSPAEPFGEIEVTLTMLDPKTIAAWAGGLPEDRQAELRGRCKVMLDNPARYDIAGRVFCQTLVEG